MSGSFVLAPRFAGTWAAATDPLGFFAGLQARHGDLVHYRGVVEFYLVNKPEPVFRILGATNRSYDKRSPLYRPLKNVTGQGLLTSEGAEWTKQRRLMQPIFAPATVRGFAEHMLEPIRATAERWQASAGSVVDVPADMTRLTLDIASRILFGMPLGDAAARLQRWFAAFSAYFMQLPMLSAPRIPTPTNVRMRRALRGAHRFVREVLEARRRLGTAHDDLLGKLIAARDESGSAMTDAELIDEVLTLVLAGYETSSAALTWTWYYLARHPEAAARLRDEVDRILGNRMPTLADLQGLSFTRMVVEEAMRLRPPVWIITRAAVDDDVVCGTRIPAGAMVVFCPYLLHRHADHWEDPEAFDPQRFRPELTAARVKGSYLPFGAGPRVCIGAQFAMQEIVFAVSVLAQRFELAFAPGQRDSMRASATLTPKHGLRMIARARNGG